MAYFRGSSGFTALPRLFCVDGCVTASFCDWWISGTLKSLWSYMLCYTSLYSIIRNPSLGTVSVYHLTMLILCFYTLIRSQQEMLIVGGKDDLQIRPWILFPSGLRFVEVWRTKQGFTALMAAAPPNEVSYFPTEVSCLSIILEFLFKMRRWGHSQSMLGLKRAPNVEICEEDPFTDFKINEGEHTVYNQTHLTFIISAVLSYVFTPHSHTKIW